MPSNPSPQINHQCGPIESHTHPSHVTITTQHAANRARKCEKAPGATESHCIGSVSEPAKPPPKLIRPQAFCGGLARVVADGHRLSVRVQRTVCFHVFTRERAALKDASSTVVIVSVSVPELKVGGGWARESRWQQALPLPNVPERASKCGQSENGVLCSKFTPWRSLNGG